MTATDIEALEAQRLALQTQLDGGKTAEDRNRMGQFATPTALAREILAHGIRLLPADQPIRFFDPGIGTGSFYSALRARCARRAHRERTRLRDRPALWRAR